MSLIDTIKQKLGQFNQGFNYEGLEQYPVNNGVRQIPLMAQMGMLAPMATSYGMAQSPVKIANAINVQTYDDLIKLLKTFKTPESAMSYMGGRTGIPSEVANIFKDKWMYGDKARTALEAVKAAMRK